MLFSRTDIAKFINENFEPAWEMVRPVPTVTIDFGNGKTIKRTLNGNIASYVCTSDGSIVDVLPGIYEPATYTAKLNEIREFASAVPTDRQGALAAIKQYHIRKTTNSEYPKPIDFAATVSGDNDVLLNNLLTDTRDNEFRRRAMIHDYLAADVVKPADIKKWLYKEVLHADLDDPYLGLDRQISGTYPFDDHQG